MGQTEGKRWWPHVRAALLALHIVAILLLSFPGSSKLGDKRRWKERRTQTQLALWAERLRGWGMEMSNEEFEAELWDLAQTYLRVRGVVTAPFEPYANFAPQGWGMFKAPPKEPTAFRIAVQADGRWLIVHDSRERDLAYLAHMLGNNRFRKQLGRTARDPVLFEQLATWLARRTFDDHPDISVVRISIERTSSLPPEQLASGTEPQAVVVKELTFHRKPGP